MSSGTHVVVGAGPVGAATAELLAANGRRVRLVSRSGLGPQRDGVDNVAADASDPARLRKLARDAAVIYSCAGPRYDRWTVEWPPLAGALLQAAEAFGALLASVSNLYVYGQVDGPMGPDMPLRPVGAKGEVRAQMWRDALAAHQAGRVRVVEVRASDYVHASRQSPLGDRVVPRLLAGRPVRVIGSANQPHSWTSVDDMARLLATVAADEQAWGRAWHVPANLPRTQRQAVEDLCRVAGVPPVRVGTVPTIALRALGVVRPEVGELLEVLYQFRRPFLIDDSETRETYGLAPAPLGRGPAAYCGALSRRPGRDAGMMVAGRVRLMRRDLDAPRPPHSRRRRADVDCPADRVRG